MRISFDKNDISLRNKGLLPCDWSINDGVRDEICKLGKISIQVTDLDTDRWPACCDRNTNNILIAKDFIEDSKYTRCEVLAVILHEVGHLVRKSRSTGMAVYIDVLEDQDDEGIGEEKAADSFVKEAGYGNVLSDCLSKLKTDDRCEMNPCHLAERLKALSPSPN